MVAVPPFGPPVTLPYICSECLLVFPSFEWDWEKPLPTGWVEWFEPPCGHPVTAKRSSMWILFPEA